MPVYPSSSPGLSAATIEEDAFCVRCGYNLKGLKVTGRCPECGTAVRGPAASRFGSSLMDAPLEYQRRLALAGWAMLAGMIAGGASWLGHTGLFGRGGSAAAYVILFLASAAWYWGVWGVTAPRPATAAPRVNTQTEWLFRRRGARVTQAGWGAGAALAFTYELAAQQTGAVPLAAAAVVLACFVGGFIGIGFVGMQLSALAFWANDDALGRKLQMAWFFLGGSVVTGGICLALSAVATSVIGLIFIVPSAVIFVGASLLIFGQLALAFWQFANLSTWATKSTVAVLDSEARRAERLKERFTKGGTEDAVRVPEGSAPIDLTVPAPPPVPQTTPKAPVEGVGMYDLVPETPAQSPASKPRNG